MTESEMCPRLPESGLPPKPKAVNFVTLY